MIEYREDVHDVASQESRSAGDEDVAAGQSAEHAGNSRVHHFGIFVNNLPAQFMYSALLFEMTDCEEERICDAAPTSAIPLQSLTVAGSRYKKNSISDVGQ